MADTLQKVVFPFRSELSLKLLIEYWERRILSGTVPFGAPLLEHIRRVPQFKEPILDRSLLDQHSELINFLMSAVIAPSQTDKELAAATVPFHFDSIFETQAFKRTIDLASVGASAVVNIPGRDLIVGKTIQACLMILQQFYNVRINFDKPIL